MPPIPPLSNGRYTLSGTLGEGGMATVYGGFDTMLEVDRAVKVLSPALCSSEKLRKRFLAEARAMAKLRHPNIVTVFDVGVDGDTPFIVMEMVDGGAVMDWVDREGAQSPEVAGHVILSALAGLQASHDRGVIHRDMKPHNLLISSEGRVKITDFGIAQLDDERSFTKTGAIMGTLAYMPPEQRISAKNLGPTADVFASGASLYALLTAKEPFDIYNESLHEQLFANVPDPMKRVITTACQYDPKNRFQTASAMSSALREAMLELGIAIDRNLTVPLKQGQLGTAFALDEVGEPVHAVSTPPESTTINPTQSWFTTGGERAQDKPFVTEPESSSAVRSQTVWLVGLGLMFAVMTAVLVTMKVNDDGTTGEPVANALSERVEATATNTPAVVSEQPPSQAAPVQPDPPAELPTTQPDEPPAQSARKVATAPTVSPPSEAEAAGPSRVEPQAAAVAPQAVPAEPKPVSEPSTGVLKVRVIPLGASMALDGKSVRLNDGSAILDVPLGRHTLSFSSPDGRSGKKEIQVAADKPLTVCWKFFDDGRVGDCR